MRGFGPILEENGILIYQIEPCTHHRRVFVSRFSWSGPRSESGRCRGFQDHACDTHEETISYHSSAMLNRKIKANLLNEKYANNLLSTLAESKFAKNLLMKLLSKDFHKNRS